MSKPPAFQFYPRDWLSDATVRLMGPAAKGLYIDLLAHQWLEGDLPSDLDELTLLVGYPVQPLWAKVEGRFQGRRGNGRLYNKRLDEQKKTYQIRRENASKAGKESARKRAKKRHESTGVAVSLQPKLNPSSATATATATTDVLSERAAPDVENLYKRLGPIVRRLDPRRDEQNRWMHWAKHQDKDIDTLESWLGGLELLRDKGLLSFVKPGTNMTCKVFMRFPELILQAETAWAKYGPGAVPDNRTGMERLRA